MMFLFCSWCSEKFEMHDDESDGHESISIPSVHTHKVVQL